MIEVLLLSPKITTNLLNPVSLPFMFKYEVCRCLKLLYLPVWRVNINCRICTSNLSFDVVCFYRLHAVRTMITIMAMWMENTTQFLQVLMSWERDTRLDNLSPKNMCVKIFGSRNLSTKNLGGELGLPWATKILSILF